MTGLELPSIQNFTPCDTPDCSKALLALDAERDKIEQQCALIDAANLTVATLNAKISSILQQATLLLTRIRDLEGLLGGLRLAWLLALAAAAAAAVVATSFAISCAGFPLFCIGALVAAAVAAGLYLVAREAQKSLDRAQEDVNDAKDDFKALQERVTEAERALVAAETAATTEREKLPGLANTFLAAKNEVRQKCPFTCWLILGGRLTLPRCSLLLPFP